MTFRDVTAGYHQWRGSLTPYMCNKTLICCWIAVCFAILMTYHYFMMIPEIRESNRHQKNLYGAQGAQRLPHAIVIGVRKGGTRAMLSYLRRHPDIRVARSEVHFFSRSNNYRQGLDWYRRVMPYSRPDQLTIEKTPAYFHTPSVPQRIHDMNSSVKLILLVRDPVKRAVSDFIQAYKNHYFWYDTVMRCHKFEDVADPNSSIHGFLWRSTYIEIIKQWLEYFPKEQLLIVDSDELIHDPITVMHETETFLGVRHYLDSSMFVRNQETGFYCIRDSQHGGDTVKDMHCLGKSKGRPHPKVDPDVIKRLHDYFRPYNEELFQLVGRRFSWEGV